MTAVVARAVSRRAVGLPVAGALVLVLATSPVLDTWADAVLRACALLLAVAAAAAVDEPDARLLDASPTSFARRVLLRLAVVAVVVVPAAVAVLAWTAGWGGSVSGQIGLELAVLVLAAVAVAAALRRWTTVAEPAVLVGPVLLLGLLLVRYTAALLPSPGWSTTTSWWVLLGLSAGLWGVALRDPATASQRRLPRVR